MTPQTLNTLKTQRRATASARRATASVRRATASVRRATASVRHEDHEGPEDHEDLPDANRLSFEPLPGSKKVYEQGLTRPDIQVPFREIGLSDYQGP